MLEVATVAPVRLEVVQGDLVAQRDVDAIVNAANAQLTAGGGVAGAVHRAAGPALAAACRSLAPIRPGTCVATGGYGLAVSHVLHCLGPVFGRDEPADELLAACYRCALALADELALTSIAFPAISTGIFGYPLAPAARIAVGTIVAEAPRRTHVRLVRLVLFDPESFAVHRSALRAAVSAPS